jgi:hypothetical protein
MESADYTNVLAQMRFPSEHACGAFIRALISVHQWGEQRAKAAMRDAIGFYDASRDKG